MKPPNRQPKRGWHDIRCEPHRQMSELILTFEKRLSTNHGPEYTVHACGQQHGHAWYGWLEFVPIEGGVTLRTERETTQPDREALAYWASGLERVYLEGAFRRARPESTTTV